jgi:chemotaxis protein MotB
MREPSNRRALSRGMLHRLDDLDENAGGAQHGYTGSSRWMVPYADLLTLLMGFFVVLYAMASTPSQSATAAEAEKPPQNVRRVVQKPSDLAQVQRKLNLLAQQTIPSADKREGAPGVKANKQNPETLNAVMHVSHQARGMVISLEDRILFQPGKAELTPEARKTLDALAGILKETPRPVRIEGHTDNTPIATAKYPSNWELSTARATNILRYLLEAQQFPPERLSASGYGEFQPVAENSSIEGKRKNRRVDIVIMSMHAAHREPGVERDFAKQARLMVNPNQRT